MVDVGTTCVCCVEVFAKRLFLNWRLFQLISGELRKGWQGLGSLPLMALCGKAKAAAEPPARPTPCSLLKGLVWRQAAWGCAQRNRDRSEIEKVVIVVQ